MRWRGDRNIGTGLAKVPRLVEAVVALLQCADRRIAGRRARLRRPPLQCVGVAFGTEQGQQPVSLFTGQWRQVLGVEPAQAVAAEDQAVHEAFARARVERVQWRGLAGMVAQIGIQLRLRADRKPDSGGIGRGAAALRGAAAGRRQRGREHACDKGENGNSAHAPFWAMIARTMLAGRIRRLTTAAHWPGPRPLEVARDEPAGTVRVELEQAQRMPWAGLARLGEAGYALTWAEGAGRMPVAAEAAPPRAQCPLLLDEGPLEHVMARRADPRGGDEAARVQALAQVGQHLRTAADHRPIVLRIQRRQAQGLLHLPTFQ